MLQRRICFTRPPDEDLVLVVDATHWLGPDAECSADRLFCQTYGRGGDQHLMVSGWP